MANLFLMIRELIQSWRMGNALRADIADDRCVACDSTDIDKVADDAYRCRACGYEGGPGWARMQQEKAAARAAALPPAQRKKEAIQLLSEARTLLLGAKGTMSGALSASRQDMLGLGGDQGRAGDLSEKWGMVNTAMADVAEARNLVKKASMRLRDGIPGFGDDDDPTVGANILDRHVDGIAMDLMAHGQIGQMAGHVDGLLGAVEASLEKLGITPPT